MPNYGTHATIGIVLGLIAVALMAYLHISNYLFYILIPIVSVIYALLPDLDHPGSKIRLFVTLCGLVAIFYFGVTKDFEKILIIDGTMLFIFVLAIFTGHRGWFHSISAAVVFSLPMVFFVDTIKFPVVSVTAFVAYCSHVISDKLLKEDNNA